MKGLTSSGISKGVEKWLDSKFFNTYDEGGVEEWAARLKSAGRKLYVTALNKDAKPLHEIDPAKQTTYALAMSRRGLQRSLSAWQLSALHPNEGLCRKFQCQC